MDRVYELDAKDEKKKLALIARIEPDPDKRVIAFDSEGEDEDDDDGDDEDCEECASKSEKGCEKGKTKCMGDLNCADLAKWLLNADSYGDVSFAKNGFAFRSGKDIGGEKDKHYLIVSAEDSFFKKYAEKRLDGIFSRCKPDVEKKILKTFKERGEITGEGFGAMYQ